MNADRLPLFCDTALVERIERAEAQLIAKSSEAARRRRADTAGEEQTCEDPLRLWAILDESVLTGWSAAAHHQRRPAGPARIIHPGDLPLPGDPGLVYLESQLGGSYQETDQNRGCDLRSQPRFWSVSLRSLPPGDLARA
ncbi:MAG: hypothetical protein ACRDRI_25180 [Pseudonocardiaceae bacterium]